MQQWNNRTMSLLDLIFPKKCINCKKFGDFLCPDCFSKIRYNESSQCPSCLKASIDGFTHWECKTETKYSIDGVISAVVYNSVARKLVRQFKYKPYVSRLSGIIGEVMNEGLAQNESFYNFIRKFEPVIVPIPLSPKRLRERGYNHAEIIGRHVTKYFKLKLDSNVLVRVKDTKPQYKLNKRERLENVQGAFGIAKNAKIPNSAILIDDVATTFATLKEAAKVLKQKGSKRVLGVTFAREL
ncbi:MAG: ComF family protein [Candidatus Levybacteria bacterium]|nr:ComF family protein [Candidatus Levybacteria bacterium]